MAKGCLTISCGPRDQDCRCEQRQRKEHALLVVTGQLLTWDARDKGHKRDDYPWCLLWQGTLGSILIATMNCWRCYSLSRQWKGTPLGWPSTSGGPQPYPGPSKWWVRPEKEVVTPDWMFLWIYLNGKLKASVHGVGGKESSSHGKDCLSHGYVCQPGAGQDS